LLVIKKCTQQDISSYKIAIISSYKIAILSSYKIAIISSYKVAIISSYNIAIISSYKIAIISSYKTAIISSYKIAIISSYNTATTVSQSLCTVQPYHRHCAQYNRITVTVHTSLSITIQSVSRVHTINLTHVSRDLPFKADQFLYQFYKQMGQCSWYSD
jgi:hypothetical protein